MRKISKLNLTPYRIVTYFLVALLSYLFYISVKSQQALIHSVIETVSGQLPLSYYLKNGLALLILVLFGYFRHRNWRLYLSLVLPIIVITTLDYSLLSTPSQILIKRESHFLYKAAIPRGVSCGLYRYMQEYLRGKKLVSFTKLGMVHFKNQRLSLPQTGMNELEKSAEVVKLHWRDYEAFPKSRNFYYLINHHLKIEFKKYSHLLSDEEYAACLKEPLKVFRGEYRDNNNRVLYKKFFFLLGDDERFSHEKEIYMLSYDRDSYFLVPRYYFLKFKKQAKVTKID